MFITCKFLNLHNKSQSDRYEFITMYVCNVSRAWYGIYIYDEKSKNNSRVMHACGGRSVHAYTPQPGQEQTAGIFFGYVCMYDSLLIEDEL